MSKLRFDVVRGAFKKKAVKVETPEGRISDYFGELVFNRDKMNRYLDADTFNSLVNCIDNGAHLDRKTADEVAAGMKTWALEHGVTHTTHWFQPLTDGTAEKHDSFMEYDGKGGMIETFDGKALVQQEPDASSFPNGGIRATFEARGYTAWDPTSPVFIQDDTLCIPTIFISYTGEALDYKTPLKKAIKAVNDAALPICRMFDPKVNKVFTYLGWEQEYFLVDEDLYAARPDLMLTGRTLMGHASSKNQQLNDHYFGAIPSRVAAFMRDIEIAGYKLGIPLKTRHNEVAPNQFELAPIYGEANLANDQNQLMMNVMNMIARKHGFVVLFHEKPFDGINGSGKHNNWSLGTDTGTQLLAPGKDAIGNLQFITFFVNVLAAVQKHNDLLKASVASAANAHRLGVNEAPPAIVSAFLGRTMSDVLRKLLELPSDTPIEIAGDKGQSFGLVEIPEIFVDNTDRNRTSPFAFTGNRFEFRAVGSSANCAGAITTLNAAVAEQLILFKKNMDREIAAGKPMNIAVMDTLKPIIKEIIDVVCFDGNGYTDEWKKEAARRGLDVETNVPNMFKAFTTPKALKLFTGLGVYSEVELYARNEVKWEIYTKKIQIESRVMGRMAINHIIPAALTYQRRLLKQISLMKDVFDDSYKTMAGVEIGLVREISSLVTEINSRVDAMVEARKRANNIEDKYKQAKAYHGVAEAVLELRTPIDKLEEIVDNDIWPLPKYRELLFIN
ncbi:MAG TPA: glutamine synthetase III [Bacteroidaceae bacterium]|jgi:glutamine synthetase|nr:glutamine synthetase III [Bacteroidaceae bacterium]OPZ48436.1 MAG: Glutamine synthetase [Bacteroidetes bacterium ADurb.BinA104]HOD68776.1 glutamine synthetase III [Bacteroidaceae bacterium]HQL26235.1 glutamine synthetase III [Bacteroidaceae bacterium]